MSNARFRAIVVDDDPIVRMTVSFALKQEGFQCDQAVDGNDALRQLSENCYDVVVTDLRMPNGHGYALSVEMLSRQPRPLVVVHSAVESPQLVNDLVSRGVDDIVEKPTNYEVFAAKLYDMVAQRVTRGQINDSTDGPSSSALGPGTTVRLPAHPVESNKSRGESKKASWWTKKPNRRVLLIDKDPSVHDDFRKILSGGGTVVGAAADGDTTALDDLLKPTFQLEFDIHSAYEPEDGIVKARDAVRDQHPFAVAFVGDNAGLETITRLWQEDRNLQIVIVSKSSAPSWSDITNQFGVRDQLLILTAPFDDTVLAQLTVSQTEKWNLARRVELHWDHMELLITERTKEIRDAHQETEALLSAISSLLIGVDTDGVIYRWNKTAEEVFGVTASEAAGKRFRDLDIKWVDTNAAHSLFEQVPLDGVTKTTVKLVRNDATRILALSVYTVLAEGEYRGCLCLGTDITSQSQLEQQLQQAQKLEAVGQLAAGVAHEINTPMQYLGDNLEYLQNKVRKLEPLLDAVVRFLSEGEEAREAGELIDEMKAALKNMKAKSFLPQVTDAIGDSRDGVQHVSRIVRAMKEFAHPGQEEKAPVDINRALESTIAVSTNEWKYVADVDTRFDDSIPLVPALAGELNQVFLNILVNAAHAIGDTNNDGATGKGTITVSTQTAGDYVEVLIADTGTGIPDEVKQRIFDPFFTTKEVGKGTGQGLAIAHSVVVLKHGGKLWCDSSPGNGTKFLIQLPVEPAANQPHEEWEPAMICQ